MPGQRLLLLVASLCALLMLGGCSTALKPIAHEPDFRLSSVKDSFITDQRRMHLAPGSPTTGFQLLDSGRDAFLVRAALIETAEQFIDAQYYIWNNDASGRYLAGRLVRSEERRVGQE